MRPEDLLARLEAGYAYDPMYGQFCNERDQLKAENAKLKKLVLDIWRPASYQVTGFQYENFKERMRELGIEVDE